MVDKHSPIREFMTTPVVTVSAGTALSDARDMMARNQIRHLPVVADDGEGIPKSSHARIFEKFGQAADRRRGRKTDTGLGLTFCRLAIEAHGGTIRVKSEVGQGATFTARLPIGRDSA